MLANVRSEPHAVEPAAIRLAVDENEIRPRMAIAEIAPLAVEGMINVTARQRLIGRQQIDDVHQQCIEPFVIPP